MSGESQEELLKRHFRFNLMSHLFLFYHLNDNAAAHLLNYNKVIHLLLVLWWAYVWSTTPDEDVSSSLTQGSKLLRSEGE